jgi:hypothetical protein
MEGITVPQIDRQTSPKQTDSTAPFVGAVARFYWMLGGNAALSLIALGIAQPGLEDTLIADVAFWVIATSLVLVRYLDIRLLAGATASGEAASFGDWRRYSTWLVLVALTVWIGAHLVRDGLEAVFTQRGARATD